MNLNLSNVSAGNKSSLPESGAKSLTENIESNGNVESKGFLQTLAGVFSGSQKQPVQTTTSAIDVSENGENQEAAQPDSNIETGVDNDVTLSMDEGLQLLGRLEQANQTLSEQGQSLESGNSLPPVLTEWQSEAATMLNDDGSTGLAQIISLEQLEMIDTKLAQGKSLTQEEVEIVEDLKSGNAIAELAEEELAQLVALPSDVRLALLETQTSQANASRQAALSSQAVGQDLKHAVVQVPAQAVDKPVLPTTAEGLAPAVFNPAIEQMVKSGEVSHKGIDAALATGALKATADKREIGELQHGLAGQLQATASQQGIATQQQARADAAQQAQLPLQLTKELANDQVAEKVQMMMSKNLKNLDIRLDPPELGRMQIRMTMNSDLANVHFTVTNPQARDIIEQTLPRLREMLAQQGMQLADSSVQQQSNGEQQGGYAAAQQNRQGADGRGFSGQSDDGFEGGVEMNVNVTSPRDGISYYA